jgi:hypothetical protein
MPNYHEIKEKELETTKDYSDKKLRRYIKLHKILLSLYSKLFFWVISFIPMLVIMNYFKKSFSLSSNLEANDRTSPAGVLF